MENWLEKLKSFLFASKDSCVSTHEQNQARIEALTLDHCWCAELRAGQVPVADEQEVTAFLFNKLNKVEHRFGFCTSKHYGDLNLYTCALCGSPVIGMTVECEGWGNSIHHYYNFPSPDDMAALSSGALNEDNYEAWVESRCGIHRDGDSGSFYHRMKVGYIGLDRLEAE